MRLHGCVSPSIGKHHARADLERFVETVEPEDVAGEAGAAGQEVFVVRLVVVTHHLGLKLIFEHFGHMVHGRVEHGDGSAAGCEQVDDRSHDVAGFSHQCGTRFEIDIESMPSSQPLDRLGERVELERVVEQVAAAQVDPGDAAEQAAQPVLEPFHGLEQRSERGALSPMGVEVESAQTVELVRLTVEQPRNLIDGYSQLRLGATGVVAVVVHQRQQRVDPQTALAGAR